MIVDAKRGDIGSTMGAYADAFLRDGSPLAGDALTVSPYLGFGSLDPAVDLALSSGRGLFVLCLTSNKEGHEVQHARDDDGVTVAARMAARAAALNADVDPLGSIGLVVGATVGDAARRDGRGPGGRQRTPARARGRRSGGWSSRAGAGVRGGTQAGAGLLVAWRAGRRTRRRGAASRRPGRLRRGGCGPLLS